MPAGCMQMGRGTVTQGQLQALLLVVHITLVYLVGQGQLHQDTSSGSEEATEEEGREAGGLAERANAKGSAVQRAPGKRPARMERARRKDQENAQPMC